jgi:hypothetical protein
LKNSKGGRFSTDFSKVTKQLSKFSASEVSRLLLACRPTPPDKVGIAIL